MKEIGDKGIPVIDSLRGLAATSVCLYHFVCTTTGYILNQPVLDIFYFGKRGVEMFFVISGIVIPLSMMSGNYTYKLFPVFIAKRFTRIEPPYLASIIVAIIYLYVRNFIPGSAPVDMVPTLRTVLLHIGYLIPFFHNVDWINSVYWTLGIEFQYYLFLALAFPLMIHSKFYVRIIFYALCILPSLLNISSGLYPHWGSLFLLGICYVLMLKKIIDTKEFWIVSILSATALVFKLGWVDLIVAIITLLIIHFAPMFTSKFGKFMGKISYSLYLLHSIVGAAFINFMSHRFNQSYQKPIVILIGLGISILSAYLFYLFIEKPSQQLSKKIKYKAEA